jgi:hypothetical protein
LFLPGGAILPLFYSLPSSKSWLIVGIELKGEGIFDVILGDFVFDDDPGCRSDRVFRNSRAFFLGGSQYFFFEQYCFSDLSIRDSTSLLRYEGASDVPGDDFR